MGAPAKRSFDHAPADAVAPATAVVASPLGPLLIGVRAAAMVRLTWSGAGAEHQRTGAGDDPLLARAARQLEEYFAGRRRAFDLPLAPPGSAFQRAVWREMLAIPYGKTRTYGDIAAAIGAAAQPVGQACGANPIPILIPCHRVIAAAGRLGGFSGGCGVETKLALLRLEGAILL